jgi:membrane protein implicated in regulation of membrane protease activity
MTGWVLWVTIAGAFGAGEVLTTGFLLAPFAVGAVAAAAVAAAGVGGAISVLVFLIVSILTLATVRPIARRHVHKPPQVPTGAAALVGKQAIVLERIVNDEGVGCVRIDGEVWTARSLQDGEVIETGTRVDVVEIKGATALVSASESGKSRTARIVPRAWAGIVARFGQKLGPARSVASL